MSQYRSYSDEALVHLVADDDHAAYMEIYDRYAGVLYVHARKKLNDREEAKDLIQELFTSFWKNRAKLQLQTQLSNYLYTAIRYRIINCITHKKLESTYLESQKDIFHFESVQTDYLLREKELKRLISSEVDCLPKKMREIFRMSRQLNLTHKEIAQELDLSEATVKKQVNNALKVLRVKLRPLFSFLVTLFV